MPTLSPENGKKKKCEDCARPFIGGKTARWGLCCRWRHRGPKAKKYFWTPERDETLRQRYDGKVKGRAAEIAAFWGWPSWQIKRRAAQLGLSYPADRREWTRPETDFLWQHAGERTARWIAKRLGRSETSVVLKFKRMKISRRVSEGYTLRDLCECFGIDHHGVERWVKHGWLNVRRRKTMRTEEQGVDPWMVSDEKILDFIMRHPLAFRLDKVDQVWFMDLVTNGGLIKKAMDAMRREKPEDSDSDRAA